MATTRTTINVSTINLKCDQDVLNKPIKEEFTQIHHTEDQLQNGCDQDISNVFIKEEFTLIDHFNDQLQIGTICEAEEKVKTTDTEIKVEKDFIECFVFQGSVDSESQESEFIPRSIPHKKTKITSRAKVHKKTQSREKPHKCDFCKQRFSYPCHLKSHTMKHTGERPFKCDTCGKQYVRNSHLKRHINTHTPESIYKCVICPKKFCYKNSMVNHMKMHTGDWTFECDICGKR
ncbi:zinc finger protein 606-like [Acyrthosiphon pisum]|uniref:C2H2-type domain-containing protein n=1 Tax=Acyrthosiphon pisum TaxID=7029 RepID=A0A8R2JL90_ACYPI|nr:zinc finger protein 606-like [Acyrthosiphon pisum]